MRLIDFFDRIYIINLPHRTDRKKATIKELENINIPLIPGRVEFFPGIRPDHKEPFHKLGSKGCFLSVIAMLKIAQSEKSRNILILQDDITFSPYFKDNEAELLKKLDQTEWDIVQFGYMPEQHCQPQDSKFCSFQVFNESLIGAHFFAINGKSIDRFLEFLETLIQRPLGDPLGGPMPIDGAINVYNWQNPDITRLISVPVFGSQRSSYSDVTPKWFDKFVILRSLVEFLRKLGIARSLKSLLSSTSARNRSGE